MDATMLIIDDSEINREILTLLFKNSFVILEAENGRDGLEILESCQGNIDIVLLDLVMPDMDGLQVLRRRRELDYFRSVPVVVITSSSTMEDQVEAFKLGANDYINKPFIPEIVVSRVNNVMASRRRMLSIELEAEQLKIKSELDQMTGLFNKTTAENAIDRVLEDYPDNLHAMLVIDIDNFKSVNDTAGHLAGDHTIRIVADLISSLFRKTDIIGRIGGDEFVVLMANVLCVDNVRKKVHELIQIMKYKPNLTIPANVSVSIGFATSENQRVTYTELFCKADEALYQAKTAGKARAQEFGQQPVDLAQDNRKAVVLLSRNRSVCSTIHSLMPAEIRIIEALNMTDLERVTQEQKEKTCIVYADVSDVSGSTQPFWQALKSKSWMWERPVLAICQEGNLSQYAEALQVGVSDILTDPLEQGAFKRRTVCHMRGILEEEETQ